MNLAYHFLPPYPKRCVLSFSLLPHTPLILCTHIVSTSRVFHTHKDSHTLPLFLSLSLSLSLTSPISRSHTDAHSVHLYLHLYQISSMREFAATQQKSNLMVRHQLTLMRRDNRFTECSRPSESVVIWLNQT